MYVLGLNKKKMPWEAVHLECFCKKGALWSTQTFQADLETAFRLADEDRLKNL